MRLSGIMGSKRLTPYLRAGKPGNILGPSIVLPKTNPLIRYATTSSYEKRTHSKANVAGSVLFVVRCPLRTRQFLQKGKAENKKHENEPKNSVHSNILKNRANPIQHENSMEQSGVVFVVLFQVN